MQLTTKYNLGRGGQRGEENEYDMATPKERRWVQDMDRQARSRVTRVLEWSHRLQASPWKIWQ